MKVGIITVHNAYNVGAMIKAYALKTTLNEMGHTCHIIDYNSFSVKSHYGIYSSSDSFVFNIKQTIKNVIKKLLRKKQHRRFDEFKNNYMNLTKKYNTIKELNEDIDMDVVFCGSDQIWNPDIMNSRDIPVFFLQFGRSSMKRVAFAPSIGMDSLDEKYHSTYSNYLNQFDKISCREISGVEILKKIVDKPIKQAVDPTLLLNCEKWSSLANDSYLNINEDYLLIYQLDYNRELVKSAIELAGKKNLKVYLISASAKKTDEVVNTIENAGPLEFLSAFKNAKYIFTNSFHGTVFSLMFEKEFYIFPHATRNTRIESILEIAGLTERIIADKSVVDTKWKEIDYIDVNERLNKHIEASRQYINEALEEKK